MTTTPETVVKITARGHRLTAAGREQLAANARHAGVVRLERTRARVTARLEDLEDLAAWGASRAEAADRAGFPSVPALEKFLQRQHRPDLLRRLPTDRQRVGRMDGRAA